MVCNPAASKGPNDRGLAKAEQSKLGAKARGDHDPFLQH
jgi:hypothetical protein